VPTLADFRAALSAGGPPPSSPPLRALWLDARGDWDAAHKSVDQREDAASMWVHRRHCWPPRRDEQDECGTA